MQLHSRNDNDFSVRYGGIAKALASLPDETVIDGEVVALDEEGKPSFNTLQNYGSSKGPLFFYIFDGESRKNPALCGRGWIYRSRVQANLTGICAGQLYCTAGNRTGHFD